MLFSPDGPGGRGAAPFEKIRPYHDGEVAPVIARLTRDPRLLAGALAVRFPSLPLWLAFFLSFFLLPFAWPFLRWRAGGIRDVKTLQRRLEPALSRLIKNSITELGCSGLENLPAGACLLVSNHRNIIMDAGLVDIIFFRNGRDTPRLGVGDNLMKLPCVSDLLRLNKSFVIRRDFDSRAAAARAKNEVAAYIRHSVLGDGASVWIAQRAGRAKDGDDRTHAGLLKMFALARDADEAFGDYIARLNIVPVSVSYEYDPCAQSKARELYLRGRGDYRRTVRGDMRDTVDGCVGFKGAVHVAFGTPLGGGFANADEAAAAIDRQIHSHYKLWAINYFAAGEKDAVAPNEREALEAYFAAMPAPWRPFALAMYARALLNHRAAAAP